MAVIREVYIIFIDTKSIQRNNKVMKNFRVIQH
jgi:hypothetical protein